MGIENGKGKAHEGWLADWNREAAILELFSGWVSFVTLLRSRQLRSVN